MQASKAGARKTLQVSCLRGVFRIWSDLGLGSDYIVEVKKSLFSKKIWKKTWVVNKEKLKKIWKKTWVVNKEKLKKIWKKTWKKTCCKILKRVFFRYLQPLKKTFLGWIERFIFRP
jgi:hypothetical protein